MGRDWLTVFTTTFFSLTSLGMLVLVPFLWVLFVLGESPEKTEKATNNSVRERKSVFYFFSLFNNSWVSKEKTPFIVKQEC